MILDKTVRFIFGNKEDYNKILNKLYSNYNTSVFGRIMTALTLSLSLVFPWMMMIDNECLS